MTDSWKEAILEHIPHGHEGQIDLSWEDAITWAKILNKRGYAVLFTSGDMDDDVKVSWLYAGAVESLDYADYDNVVFSHMDYFDDYVNAYNEEYGNAHEEEDTDDTDYIPEPKEWNDEDEIEVLPTRPEVSE